MSTIFISHSSRDKEIARDLERRLAEQCHPSVFLDLDPEKGIVAGQSWERTLYRKLRGCRAVIAICTDSYLSSHWCFAEIALARMMGKIIFALKVQGLADDARMPTILTEKQFIDLRTHEAEGYRRLWGGLKEEDVLGIGSAYDARKEGPYLGLSTFEEKHAAIFFGRDAEIRAGVEALERGAPGLIMVLGASGSGKSSLVRAGIVPRVKRDPEQWILVDPFRPGTDPFMELATVLERAYGSLTAPGRRTPTRQELCRRLKAGAAALPRSSPASGRTSVESGPAPPGPGDPESRLIDSDDRLPRLIEHLESLRSNPPVRADSTLLDFLDWSVEDLRSLFDRPAGERPARDADPESRTPLQGIARHLRRVSGHTLARVLVIIDQFEETFGHDDQELANQFLKLIRASVEAEHSPLVVIGTMRSDFLGVFQRNGSLRGVEFASLSLGPMTVDAMRQVIEKPAELADITFQDGLADRLLQDTETPDALPLLSFTLWKLYQDYVGAEDRVLEIEEYANLGGIHGAIATEAESVAEVARNQNAEDDLRKAFLRMARLNEEGNSYVRQAASVDDPEIVRVASVLRLFEKRRLVVFRKEGDAEFVEVAHEALFRSWDRLKNWLDNNRAEMLLRQQIQRDAAVWEKARRSPECLWRGARLLQAQDLMKRQRLSPAEEIFVRQGLRRRTKVLFSGAGIAAAVVAAILIFAFVARSQRDRAVEAQADAETARVEAEDSSRLGMALEWLDRNQATNAALTLLDMKDPEAFPFAPARMSEALERGIARLELRGHGDAGAYRAGFSEDGTRIVTAGRDGRAIVWDAESGTLLHTLSSDDGELNGAAFSPDGRHLITVGSMHVSLWTLNEDSPRRESVTAHGKVINDVTFSPDGAWVLAAGDDGMARIWDVNNLDFDRSMALEGHAKPVESAAFSADGTRIVTAGLDGKAIIWDAKSGVRIKTLSPDDGELYDAAFSPDGRRVVIVGANGYAAVWDVDRARTLRVLKGHEDVVHGAAVSSTGLVATVGFDRTVRLWDLETGESLRVIEDHTDRVLSAAFSPDGSWLVTASDDLTVRVWDTRLRSKEGPNRSFLVGPLALRGNWSGKDKPGSAAIEFAPDGDKLVMTFGESAFVWNAARGGEIPVSNSAPVFRAAFRDGGLRLVGSRDNMVQLWSSEDPASRTRLDGGTDDSYIGKDVRVAVASPDGRFVATTSFPLKGTQGEVVRIWDARSGMLLKRLDHDDYLWDLAFSGDGAWFATASGTVARVWNIETDSVVTLDHKKLFPDLEENSVTTVAFSHDGQRLVTGGWNDFTAIVWNVKTGDVLGRLRHPEAVRSVAFSPDDRWIATATDAGESSTSFVYIWDAATQTDVWKRDLKPTQVAYALAFSPDGQRLAAGLNDGSAMVWDVGVGWLWSMAREATRACLSPESHRQIGILSDEEIRREFVECGVKYQRDSTRPAR